MSEENTAQNPDQSNTEQTQEQSNTESQKTFNQTEVNALLADQKRKIQSKFADYDELKTTVTNLDTIKSEAFENGKSTATNQLLGKLIETEIRANAESLGFADASDALTFFGDKDSITYDPENGLDRSAITSRLTDLATNKPYLLKTEQVKGTSDTSRPKPHSARPVDTGNKDDTKERAAAALRNKYLK